MDRVSLLIGGSSQVFALLTVAEFTRVPDRPRAATNIPKKQGIEEQGGCFSDLTLDAGKPSIVRVGFRK